MLTLVICASELPVLHSLFYDFVLLILLFSGSRTATETNTPLLFPFPLQWTYTVPQHHTVWFGGYNRFSLDAAFFCHIYCALNVCVIRQGRSLGGWHYSPWTRDGYVYDYLDQTEFVWFV